jgi:hypothetical protein
MYRYGSYFATEAPPRRGPGALLRRLAVWAAVGFLALVVLGSTLWAFGLLFHLVGLLLKVALVTAVAAAVWRFVSRGRFGRSRI